MFHSSHLDIFVTKMTFALMILFYSPVSVVPLHLRLGEAAAAEEVADPGDDHGDDGPLLGGGKAALLKQGSIF